MVAENKVAKRVKQQAKYYGLTAIRISMRPGVEVGWPDYLVLGPNRFMLGVETKATKKKPSRIQMERGNTLNSYGFAWAAPDSEESVDLMMRNFAAMCCGERLVTKEEFLAAEAAKRKMN